MPKENEATAVDHIVPGSKWEFGDDVAHVFDNMLKRSIPQYDVMRKAVTDLGMRYAQPGSWIVDLGCSRGEALAPFVEALGDQCSYLGIEVSEPMLAAAQARFADNPDVIIERMDLRKQYPSQIASATLCVLTLQFTPIEYRHRILRNIYNHMKPNGALILVEKVLGSAAEMDSTLVDLYYQLKGENGYNPEDIERKRLSLEGVLVPVTAKWNEELLHSAGFGQIECFWRWMNFAGWVAVKTVR